MPIDFAPHERGAPFSGDFAAALDAVQGRIASLSTAQVVHHKRTLVVLEGWVGAGKTAALSRLVAALDPCHTKVLAMRDVTERDDERHWFAPFWEALPAGGETTIFFRSWYSRAATARRAGALGDRGWHRAIDEINEFENQQREHGTALVKLFFHVSPEVQAERIRERAEDPWARHLFTAEQVARIGARAEMGPIAAELLDATDTRWAPWTMIDAADPRSAQTAALGAVAAAMAKSIPADPPADVHSAEVVDLDSRRRG
ncbi:polyphosphate kinase [Sphingomonas sp. ASV193]|uniref:polyphosphate kinase n=1 Tax=Sphingomonas sp. ASV193 TaxID=3144405 RepID=UPI0032E93831